MNDMVVKSVDVMGDTVMAAQDKKGRIFAGVSYFCNALGMTRGQKNRQVKNVQKDETLKRGCIKLGAGVLDEGNEAVALRIDFIPIWLAKISITDKTKQDNPELADKLLNYQLKAKDILAEAFIPKQEIPRTIPGQIQLLAQGMNRDKCKNYRSEWEFAIVSENGVVKQIGKSCFYHPVVRFNNGDIKWFDDNRLFTKDVDGNAQQTLNL